MSISNYLGNMEKWWGNLKGGFYGNKHNTLPKGQKYTHFEFYYDWLIDL